MTDPRNRVLLEAERVLQQARSEFTLLEEPWDSYQVDIELLATILFGLGVQRVPDLRVGDREYAGILDARARLIAVEELHHEHRQRFSVAHEVGHFVLHFRPQQGGDGLFACTTGDMEVSAAPRGGNERAVHLQQEAEANLFAAALLMPAPAVRAMHKVTGGVVVKLAKHFRVSPKAMEIRLTQLHLPYTPVHR